jgi:hypothetical protein
MDGGARLERQAGQLTPEKRGGGLREEREIAHMRRIRGFRVV